MWRSLTKLTGSSPFFCIFKFPSVIIRTCVHYSGVNVRLAYFVRVTITRNYNSCTKDQEFAVQNFSPVNSNVYIIVTFVALFVLNMSLLRFFIASSLPLTILWCQPIHRQESRWRSASKTACISNLNSIGKSITSRLHIHIVLVNYWCHWTCVFLLRHNVLLGCTTYISTYIVVYFHRYLH